MIDGLDKFKKYFADFSDKFILIGGAACDILMDEVGINFRATKDLDIVLIVESKDEEFAKQMWAFIKDAQYEIQEACETPKVYRFQNPKDKTYPYMLEFFARKPELIILPEASHLTPIPFDGEVSSLSAILLDEDYYKIILSGKKIVDGIPLVTPETLIILKCKAYIDLNFRSRNGEEGNTRKINKHKNDILRVSQLLSSQSAIYLPSEIKKYVTATIEDICSGNMDLKAIGILGTTIDRIKERITGIFQDELS